MSPDNASTGNGGHQDLCVSERVYKSSHFRGDIWQCFKAARVEHLNTKNLAMGRARDAEN